MSLALQQVGGGDQHSGRADPTLRGAGFEECALQRIQGAVVTEPLYRGHPASGDLGGGDEAGADLLVVEEHGARAAITRLATDLGPAKLEVLAQHVGEPSYRVAVDAHLAAVQVKRDAHSSGSASSQAPPSSAAGESQT